MASTRLTSFEGVFTTLVEDIKAQCVEQYELPPRVWQWFEKSLNHNALGGKCNRGLSVVDAARLLLERDLTPGEYFQTATLGWMVELLQAMMLVLDDIMDGSETRRGKPSWYLVPGVGMIAVNDAPMLESAIYLLLKKHFREHPAYVDMMELFHEASFRTELGQTCDLLAARQDSVGMDFAAFNHDAYSQMVAYKTAYYSFHLPVALAMLYCGCASSRNLEQAESILAAMGTYFQAQDDYLDVFTDSNILGKVGTDIVDGKCSWLAVQALERCNVKQRRVLEENYGRKEHACEVKVQAVFHELKLKEVYTEYEDGKVAELRQMIDKVDETEGLKKSVLSDFLSKIHKRDR
ncbi:isoprenoid synthase domain-containing protein [Aspergillus karnatakaensis]|uniref:FPP/GGPP synthase family protein n=1 Tax=Aspergillus karnatakaensis TaxID=1810916 RepID=UPI003CCD7576